MPAPLTDREQQVLACTGRGMTPAEIGRELGIGAGTARTYMNRVLQRLVGHLLPSEGAMELGLSRREVDVLAALQRGDTNAQIATELGISVRTAEDHVAKVLRKTRRPSRFDLLSRLAREARRISPRERQVIELVAQGLSNGAIAERLQISPRTVESHIGHALKKTGASSRAQLRAVASKLSRPR